MKEKNKKQKILLATCIAIFCSCKVPEQKQEMAATTIQQATGTYSLIESPFGKLGTDSISLYSITNPSGTEVDITNYGGTVTKIITKDKDGKKGDVILGFDDLAGYIQPNNPYFGCLVGRYANRIKAGRFELEGKTYSLPLNDHGNTLHGGFKGFDKVVWKAKRNEGDSSITLTYLSKDGEEGFPGNVSAVVTYTLQSDNSLQISYSATTDKATPLSLTSHCYFNLSAGADSTILNHQLTLYASQFTPVDDKLIPTGKIFPVAHSPMDFTTTKKIGKDIASVSGGYDHNWILDKGGNTLTKAATVYDATSGRQMEVFTTEPALQFYTGNFLDGTLHGKDGKEYVKHGAFCLEAQHYPNSPNEPTFPNTFLKPGETYKQTTIYSFSIK